MYCLGLESRSRLDLSAAFSFWDNWFNHESYLCNTFNVCSFVLIKISKQRVSITKYSLFIDDELKHCLECVCRRFKPASSIVVLQCSCHSLLSFFHTMVGLAKMKAFLIILFYVTADNQVLLLVCTFIPNSVCIVLSIPCIEITGCSEKIKLKLAKCNWNRITLLSGVFDFPIPTLFNFSNSKIHQ